MVEGIWEMIPSAEVWHIGSVPRMRRRSGPVAYYNRLPIHLTVSVCLILDPMLATGGSAVKTVEIRRTGGPAASGSSGLSARPKGSRPLPQPTPTSTSIWRRWTATNEHAYIVPSATRGTASSARRSPHADGYGQTLRAKTRGRNPGRNPWSDHERIEIKGRA